MPSSQAVLHIISLVILLIVITISIHNYIDIHKRKFKSTTLTKFLYIRNTITILIVVVFLLLQDEWVELTRISYYKNDLSFYLWYTYDYLLVLMLLVDSFFIRIIANWRGSLKF